MAIAAALIAYAIDFVTHGMILMKAYSECQGMFGSEAQIEKWIWLNPIAYFGMTFLLGWFFIRGYANRGVMEGLIFGVMAGLLMEVPRFCFMVMYYNQPAIMDAVPLIAGMVKFILIGIAFGAIYKPATKII